MPFSLWFFASEKRKAGSTAKKILLGIFEEKGDTVTVKEIQNNYTVHNPWQWIAVFVPEIYIIFIGFVDVYIILSMFFPLCSLGIFS